MPPEAEKSAVSGKNSFALRGAKLELVDDAVAHRQSCLQGRLRTSELFIGKIFRKLPTVAPDVEPPALKGCRVVGVSGDVFDLHGAYT